MRPVQVSALRKVLMFAGRRVLIHVSSYLFLGLLALSVLFHLAERHQPEYATWLGTKLVVHSSVSRGVSRLFDEMLGFQGSEIHRARLGRRFAGKTYTDLMIELRHDHRVGLLALISGAVLHVNPREEILVKEGDEAFVLAEREPDGLGD